MHAHGRLADRQALRMAGEQLLQAVANGSLIAPQRREFDFATLPDALRQLKEGQGAGKWVTRLG